MHERDRPNCVKESDTFCELAGVFICTKEREREREREVKDSPSKTGFLLFEQSLKLHFVTQKQHQILTLI